MIPPIVLAAAIAPPQAIEMMRSGRYADRMAGVAVLESAIRQNSANVKHLRIALLHPDPEVRCLASGIAKRLSPRCPAACVGGRWDEVTWQGSSSGPCSTCGGWGLNLKWLEGK